MKHQASSIHGFTIVSICQGEKVQTCKSKSFIQSRANPPPKFLLSTMNKLSNFRRQQSHSRYDFFFFISMRKTTLGPFAFTISKSSQTRRWFPSPRQFQLKQFMMNGEAEMQPPPMKKFGECHGEIFLSFF